MLEQLFGSRTRAKLIKLFFNNPHKSYYVREITRKIGERINSVRRELANLTDLGLLKSFNQGKLKFYQANSTFVLFNELKNLVFKVHLSLENNFLKRLQKIGSLKLLLLTGRLVGNNLINTDILIVGRLNKKKLRRLMNSFQKSVDRELNYTVLSPREYRYRKEITDRFLYSILEGKKIILVNQIDPSL
jgi:DNA-binding transcriptional ArsR family regulator